MRPILRTERLLLDPHRVEDFEDCHAIWSDPAVMRLIAPPSSRHESWTRMLRFAGSWPLLGFGFFAVREAASGRYAGDVGFQDCTARGQGFHPWTRSKAKPLKSSH